MHGCQHTDLLPFSGDLHTLLFIHLCVRQSYIYIYIYRYTIHTHTFTWKELVHTRLMYKCTRSVSRARMTHFYELPTEAEWSTFMKSPPPPPLFLLRFIKAVQEHFFHLFILRLFPFQLHRQTDACILFSAIWSEAHTDKNQCAGEVAHKTQTGSESLLKQDNMQRAAAASDRLKALQSKCSLTPGNKTPVIK